jgi:hypothetical protein
MRIGFGDVPPDPTAQAQVRGAIGSLRVVIVKPGGGTMEKGGTRWETKARRIRTRARKQKIKKQEQTAKKNLEKLPTKTPA